MAWAAEQATGSPTRKAVLMALANAANHHTGSCHPSIERLAEETEFSPSAVKRALSELAAAGHITRKRRRRGDGSLGTYTYEFPHHGAQVANQGSQRADQGAEEDLGPGGAATSQNLEVHPEPGSEPVLPAAPFDPLVGQRVQVEGQQRPQDLPWNALAEVTDTVEEANGPRMKRALATIRKVFLGYMIEQFGEQARAEAAMNPGAYEFALAHTIEHVGRYLRERSPELTWGPEGVARNFNAGLRALTQEPNIDRIVEEARRGKDAG